MALAARPLFALLALLACVGCATGLVEAPPADGDAAGLPVFAFQQKSLAPPGGGRLIAPSDLRTGDILLSAEGTALSAGIRLLTLAPVSHAALYVGDGEVAEALGGGVRLRRLATMIEEESVIAVLRQPRLDDATAQRIGELARDRVGWGYDYAGTFLYAPFSLQRVACEVPVLPALLRGACIRTLATLQLGLPGRDDRFFCSSFVLDTYRDAGAPITDVRPKWLSPGDILHMREGDVSALPVLQTLRYVGHLKFSRWALDLPALHIPLSAPTGAERPASHGQP